MTPASVPSGHPAAMASSRRSSSSRSRSRRAWAAMSSAPRSRRHPPSGPRTSSANRSVMSTGVHATGDVVTVPPAATAPDVTGGTAGGTAATVPPMFPGAHAETTPDAPAVILGGSGQVITYAELDAEANRVSHVFRSLGLQPGRPRRPVPREPPALLRARVGRPLRRPLLHGHELAAHDRRDGLHHRGLRGAGVRDLRLQGRPGGRAGAAASATTWRSTCSTATIEGYDCWEDALDAQPADPPARGPGRGPRHALLVGHHRPAQGRRGAAARRPARHPRPDLHAGHRPVRGDRRQRLPLPGAAVPRRPAALLHGRSTGSGATVDRHGALRPRRGPGPDRDATA